MGRHSIDSSRQGTGTVDPHDDAHTTGAQQPAQPPESRPYTPATPRPGESPTGAFRGASTITPLTDQHGPAVTIPVVAPATVEQDGRDVTHRLADADTAHDPAADQPQDLPS